MCKTKKYADVNRRKYYWEVTARKAASLSEEILPYLDEKKQQCQLLLDFQSVRAKGGWGLSVPKEISSFRSEIDAELRRLKQFEY